MIKTADELLGALTGEQLEQLEDTFPAVDLKWEAGNCAAWWSGKRKQMKNPWLAFRNWLKKSNGHESGYVTNARTQAKAKSRYY